MQMLCSKVEYFSARLYNSSIIVGKSKDNEWKNGVDSAKLLLKFCKIASMLDRCPKSAILSPILDRF